MKRFQLFALFLCVITALSAQKSISSNLLKDIVAGKFDTKKPPTVTSMINGEFYTQLTEDGKKIIQYSYKTGKEEQVLFDVEKAKGVKLQRIEGYSFSPTEKTMLVYTNAEKLFRRSFVADYYVFDLFRNKLEALSDSVGKQRDPVYSPNGRLIVFGKGNDLRLKKLDYGTETIVTTSGKEGQFFNGVTDWMYEEEFGVTNLIAWSADSKYFAYVSLDNTQVGEYAFDVFGNYPITSTADLYPTSKKIKYPKTGTANPIPTVYIFDVFYKNTKKVDLKVEGEIYIPRMKWINSTEDFAVFTLNRNQDQLKLFSVNSKSLLSGLLLEEKSATYVDYTNIDYVQFLKDNKFTIASERDGYRHLYLYSATGILEKQLTSGNFDITNFYGCDTTKQLFYFQSAETSPLNRDVYCVDLKGKKVLLSEGKGTNSASFNSSFTYFVKESSTAKTPLEFSICTASGKKVRELVAPNSDLAQRVASLPQKEFLTIKNAEGIELNAWMIKPAGFDAGKKYPVVMYQYSGPNSQEVADEFAVGFEQELVANGFVVVCVDGRGTGARGEKFRKSTYQQLGTLEAKDQVAAAKFVGTLPYVDKNRIGIWGWSYGGFITLMSMSTGEKIFAAGVAVAPATDFKFYDTAYTERYMRRPQENLTGYETNSPMALASKLNGRLLLIAGTADDNTHIQNTYQYAEQLVQANKQFDMQIYTNRNHGLKGGNTRYHLYTRITQFFVDNLK
ncbi:MAG: alpha/beta fold hydrolase [Paludibacteraceae bacterium]|nr:alpha/beta fold hydrolase [Paludibacteraceae bacterium]MBN2787241.1 alpha/beta fold hydrolase [Paludibacteraceae bacterium]